MNSRPSREASRDEPFAREFLPARLATRLMKQLMDAAMKLAPGLYARLLPAPCAPALRLSTVQEECDYRRLALLSQLSLPLPVPALTRSAAIFSAPRALG